MGVLIVLFGVLVVVLSLWGLWVVLLEWMFECFVLIF